MALQEDSFVGDLAAEGMLQGIVMRATVDRGEILSISYPKVPREITLLFPEEVPGEPAVSLFSQRLPLFAERAVAFRGEPIMLLCGPDERRLAELAEEIEIRYRTESPLGFAQPLETQIAERREVVIGAPDRAFDDAFQIVEGEYTTCAQEYRVSDPPGALVAFEGERVVVSCPTQWPFHVRNVVAAVLGLPRKRVEVRVTRMSPPRDSRIWFSSVVAAQCALLAWKSRRPVRLLLGCEEASAVQPRRAPSRIHYRTALDRDGNPVAHDIDLSVDCGAAPMLGEELLERALLAAAGPYQSTAYRLRARLVTTSVPPMDAFQGLGLAQGFFAAETHASRIAELTQTDPFTWKERNLIRRNGLLAGGAIPANYLPTGLLARTVELSDFARKYAAYEMLKKRRETIRDQGSALRGIGLAVAYQGAGFMTRSDEPEPAAVVVRLEANGSLYILTSGVSPSGEARAAWTESAARILGIEPKRIFVSFPDTSLVPNSGPSALSRNITIIGELVERACETVVRKRFRAALPIEVKKTLKLPRANRWNPEEHTGLPFDRLSWAAAAVETEVDPVTLETEVRGIWTTVSCGRVMMEAAARRVVENGIVHALWWCSSSHGSERSPALFEFPPITIEFLSAGQKGWVGGIEELAACVIPSAYVSAVAQATSRYFDTLPITPELIHRYTEEP